MKNKTQKERVVGQLLKVGYISRNACLRNYITRLSAYILELKEEGWEFDAKNVDNDYVYYIVKTPYKTASYKLSDGREIKTLTK